MKILFVSGAKVLLIFVYANFTSKKNEFLYFFAKLQAIYSKFSLRFQQMQYLCDKLKVTIPY